MGWHYPCPQFRSINEEMKKKSSLGRKRSQRTNGEIEAWRAPHMSGRSDQHSTPSEPGPAASNLQFTGPLPAPAQNTGAEHCGVQGQRGARKGRYVVRSGSRVCVGMTVWEGAQAGPQAQAALRRVSEVWPARGGGMGGEQRLCWGRTKGEDKDYFIKAWTLSQISTI